MLRGMIVMHRNFKVAAFCIAAVCLFGCAKEGQKPANTPAKALSPHSTGADSKQSDQPQSFVGIVSNQKLPLSTTKTIGTVFDEYRYFNSREWKETRNAAGRVYVDFKGLFASPPIAKSIKDGVSRQGVEVKFVVEPNGNFYVGMISRIDVTADGKMKLYPVKMEEIIEQIYANKEITF